MMELFGVLITLEVLILDLMFVIYLMEKQQHMSIMFGEALL